MASACARSRLDYYAIEARVKGPGMAMIERKLHTLKWPGKGVALPPRPPLIRLKPKQSPASLRSRRHDGSIPAWWRWMPNFLRNARSTKQVVHCGSNGLATFRIFMWRR